jgi:hypothetical protein
MIHLQHQDDRWLYEGYGRAVCAERDGDQGSADGGVYLTP